MPTADPTPHPTDRHVGARIRLRRKALKLTQTDVAERLGLTFQQLQKYERGGNRVSASKLHELAGILRVPHGWFFEGLPGAPAAGGMPETAEDRLVREQTLDPEARALLALWAALDVGARTALMGVAFQLARAGDDGRGADVTLEALAIDASAVTPQRLRMMRRGRLGRLRRFGAGT